MCSNAVLDLDSCMTDMESMIYAVTVAPEMFEKGSWALGQILGTTGNFGISFMQDHEES
jgi:hypothetical protein